MSVEVLVSTMHQNNSTVFNLIERMNLQSDSIIINQTDYNGFEQINVNGNHHRVYSFNERGVGLSRNTALMRTKADYALLADDDLIYMNDYTKIVEDQFQKYSGADVIIFNLLEKDSVRYTIKNPFKVTSRNYMRFGAARIAFRPESIQKKGISFHLLFGGGARFSNGEDTIFLKDCIKKGLKVVAVPITIAELTNERESTWFKGFNKKYYFDRGALFKALSPTWYPLLITQFVIRKYNASANMPRRREQLFHMMRGAREL